VMSRSVRYKMVCVLWHTSIAYILFRCIRPCRPADVILILLSFFLTVYDGLYLENGMRGLRRAAGVNDTLTPREK
jgi:hypothetical protein